MIEIIGIRFKPNGKTYYFAPGALDLPLGVWVVVETARGQECGEVVSERRFVAEDEIPGQLKPVLRLVTEAELERIQANAQRLSEVFAIGQQRIDQHQLDMKLVDVEFSFDGKLLFYFTSEGRVDFRNLVRDLASIFHTRIELRQIGVRDEARMIGGLGPCGRGICCKEFLSAFQPVSIKMAKEQNLSLNPTKISGLCGRLMCCLKYEQDAYEHARKRAPKPGREVMTPDGAGIVGDFNVLREKVCVRIALPDGASENRWYPLNHIGPPGKPLAPEILKEIEDAAAAIPPTPAQKSSGEPRERSSPPRQEAPPRRPAAKAPRPAPAEGREPRPSKPAKPAAGGADPDTRRLHKDARQQSLPKQSGGEKPVPKTDDKQADRSKRSIKPWKPRDEDARPPQQNPPKRPQKGDQPAPPPRNHQRSRSKPARRDGNPPQET